MQVSELLRQVSLFVQVPIPHLDQVWEVYLAKPAVSKPILDGKGGAKALLPRHCRELVCLTMWS
jgi:hypothetical protein